MTRLRPHHTCTLLLLLAVGARLEAQSPTRVDTVRVVGRIDNLHGIARSASQGRIGATDLRQRPITREGELLETVPGLIVTQHSGDGKANQYFVRGFNLDHGTDFQTRVEGMPVNMPSHAHGQGYTDINFLIPELVQHLEYKLGVSHVEQGDFGSAGGAEFHLSREIESPFGSISRGANGFLRLAAGGSRQLGAGTLLLGGEGKRYDGPWIQPQGLAKWSGVARYSVTRGSTDWSVLGMAYTNRWRATDQIPLRAVQNGSISRFGSLDSTDGGNAERYSLSASFRTVSGTVVRDGGVYAVRSRLRLFSNFGYFLDDQARGDQFAQQEQRTVVGMNLRQLQQFSALGTTHTLKVGAESRVDFVTGLGLYNTVARARAGTVRDDRVNQASVGTYVETESRWTPWLRTVVGTRGDLYSFAVRSDRSENSGDRTAGIVSPKASLILSPTSRSEVYLSGGFGFHSNDARGSTITIDPRSGERASRVDPLVRSRGAELGLRLSPVSALRTTASVWMLDLDSELLFVGDAGATEASGASRRSGVTLAQYYQPIRELALDVDVSFARARLGGATDGAQFLPGAMERVLAAGVTWSRTEQGVFGAMRVRHFGDHPLVEDNSVRGSASSLVNADVGYEFRSGTRVQFNLLNVLNARANDVQYFYASRLPGEPAGGVSDVHFHPAEPRQVRMSLEWKF